LVGQKVALTVAWLVDLMVVYWADSLGKRMADLSAVELVGRLVADWADWWVVCLVDAKVATKADELADSWAVSMADAKAVRKADARAVLKAAKTAVLLADPLVVSMVVWMAARWAVCWVGR